MDFYMRSTLYVCMYVCVYYECVGECVCVYVACLLLNT